MQKIDSIKILKVYESPTKEQVAITSPNDIALEFDFLKGEFQENFWVVNVDTKNKIINKNLVSMGTVNSTMCHPRDVFRSAIVSNATSIIIVHNHPSGSTTPSDYDINITKTLNEAGKILGIKVLDHIIIGDNYFSFKENNYL